MDNDIAVRNRILKALPHLEPWRIEMEEIDFGDKMGIFYRSPDGPKRCALPAKNVNDDTLVEGFLSFIKAEPRVIEAKTTETELANAPNYEGRAGRHPTACVCQRCVNKRG